MVLGDELGRRALHDGFDLGLVVKHLQIVFGQQATQLPQSDEIV